MLTKDFIIENYKDFSIFLDDRFGTRFADFLTKNEAIHLGIFTDEAIEKWDDSKVKDWTEENVIEQLRCDVDFGFEKALDQRGISSSLMFEVVRRWNKVLENELAGWDDNNYAMYGLPLFKATALLYGFDNPIGDDEGTESCYGDE